MTDQTSSPAATPPVVLVVEAEPLLQIAAVETIEEAGYEALTARSIDQAIAILERRPDVRIVFTDIDMPRGLDGMRLAACVRNRWPPIEIILTSDGLAPAMDQMPDRSIFLPKPYSSRRLVDAVQGMVANV